MPFLFLKGLTFHVSLHSSSFTQWRWLVMDLLSHNEIGISVWKNFLCFNLNLLDMILVGLPEKLESLMRQTEFISHLKDPAEVGGKFIVNDILWNTFFGAGGAQRANKKIWANLGSFPLADCLFLLMLLKRFLATLHLLLLLLVTWLSSLDEWKGGDLVF